jgi:cysteine desulfurase
MQKIYFDNAATTKLDPKVFEAMTPYFAKIFGNASSLHTFGLEAKRALEDARESIAQAIGAKHNEIIFTSGATEADNLALRGIAYANHKRGNHIITSAIEHPAVMETCHFLEAQGFKVSFLPVGQKGIVNPQDIKKSLCEDTILISIMSANNEIGSIQPIREIGKIVASWNKKHSNYVYFHTDAVQAFTKLDINVKDLRLDLMSLSAHKIYGPKGVGALYVKEGTPIDKILFGGRHEYNLRPGTENVASIVGFARAVKLFNPETYNQVKKLRAYLVQKILKEIPESFLNGPDTESALPNIANFTFKKVEGEALMLLLDKEGIAVSTGSACASHSLEPSYVLRAIGVSQEDAHGSVRFSLGKDNTPAEIDFTVNVLRDAVKKLRKMSPLD